LFAHRYRQPDRFHATAELLPLAQRILQPEPGQILALADSEHFTLQIIGEIIPQSRFDLLVPMPQQPYYRRQFEQIPQRPLCRVGPV